MNLPFYADLVSYSRTAVIRSRYIEYLAHYGATREDCRLTLLTPVSKYVGQEHYKSRFRLIVNSDLGRKVYLAFTGILS